MANTAEAIRASWVEEVATRSPPEKNAVGTMSACSHPRNFGFSRAPTALSSVTRPTRLEVSPTALETEIGSQHSTRLEPTQSGVHTCSYRAVSDMGGLGPANPNARRLTALSR